MPKLCCLFYASRTKLTWDFQKEDLRVARLGKVRRKIYGARLAPSHAAKSGLLTDLEDTALMIEGISRHLRQPSPQTCPITSRPGWVRRWQATGMAIHDPTNGSEQPFVYFGRFLGSLTNKIVVPHSGPI
jgi:hypothetical protein